MMLEQEEEEAGEEEEEDEGTSLKKCGWTVCRLRTWN